MPADVPPTPAAVTTAPSANSTSAARNTGEPPVPLSAAAAPAPTPATTAAPAVPAPTRHVLFVCTGNTCRSAMAEALFRHALKGQPAPLGALAVRSAGLLDAGSPASPNALRVLWAVGIDASRHRSQHITRALADDAIAIFAMGRRHAEAVRNLCPNLRAPLRLLREFAPAPAPIAAPASTAAAALAKDLPDPYGGGIREYQECRDNIVETIPGVLAFLGQILSTDSHSTASK